MIARLAVVLWWCGAAFIAAGVALLCGLFFQAVVHHRPVGAEDVLVVVSPAFIAIPFWTLCYVLAGSFIRPPKTAGGDW